MSIFNTVSGVPNVDPSVMAQYIRAKNQMPQNEPQQNTNIPIGSVSFIIRNNGEIGMEYHWFTGENEGTAKAMSYMLYHLNSGKMEQKMKKVLQEYAQQHIVTVPFIQRIIELWNKEKSEPLISPYIALKIGNAMSSQNIIQQTGNGDNEFLSEDM